MRTHKAEEDIRGSVTSLLYKCLNSTGSQPVCQAIIQYTIQIRKMQMLREHSQECLSGEYESRMMSHARAKLDSTRNVHMLGTGQKEFDDFVGTILDQKWNFESARVIFDRMRRKCRQKSTEYSEVIMCVDESALRAYYRDMRSNPPVLMNRQLTRIYPNCGKKYFVETVDGFLKLIGELVTSKCVIIDGVPDAHGKEDTWLLHIRSGESQLTGFAKGWHAIG